MSKNKHHGIEHVTVTVTKTADIGVHREGCAKCDALTPMPSQEFLESAVEAGDKYVSPGDYDSTNYMPEGWISFRAPDADEAALYCPKCAARIKKLLR